MTDSVQSSPEDTLENKNTVICDTNQHDLDFVIFNNNAFRVCRRCPYSLTLVRMGTSTEHKLPIWVELLVD
jgi:hypothetical protein